MSSFLKVYMQEWQMDARNIINIRVAAGNRYGCRNHANSHYYCLFMSFHRTCEKNLYMTLPVLGAQMGQGITYTDMSTLPFYEV